MSLTNKGNLLDVLKDAKEEIKFLNNELRDERTISRTYREVVASCLKTTISPPLRARLASTTVHTLNNTIRQLDMDIMEGKK